MSSIVNEQLGEEFVPGAMTAVQKLWLAQQVNDGIKSAFSLHHDLNIPYRSITKYAFRYRKGFLLSEKSGRPKRLDFISIQAIRSQLVDNPDMDRSNLVKHIRDEAKLSWDRRYARHFEVTGEELGFQKMSRTSIRRYVAMFRSGL